MKYCVDYRNNFRHTDKVDEVLLRPAEWKNFNFKKYPKVRMILNMSQADAMGEDFMAATIIHTIREARENGCTNSIAVLLTKFMVGIVDRLKEEDIPFFFNTFADTLDMFHSLVDIGACDIYIVNELGFRLKSIAPYAKSKGIKLRTFPNVSQSGSTVNKNYDVKTGFYIRPEDIPTYEGYIDVCEFFGPVDKMSVLYEIYTDGTWRGHISNLIYGLDTHIPNNCFPPYFGERRLVCGKRCYAGEFCDFCSRAEHIAELLDEKELHFGNDIEIDDEDLYADGTFEE